jgi:Putative zinc-finger
MNDCPNAVIRDQLPDLLHDRLDASARAAVTAHVATCADCRDELELLRGVHGMLVSRTPRIDVATIVAALPRADGAQAPQLRTIRPRRTWADWRVAAAVTLLVAGGSSVALYRHGGMQASPIDAPAVAVESVTPAPAANAVVPVAAASTPAPGSTRSRVVAAETVALRPDDGAEAAPAVASAAAGLNDTQMKALLDDINRLEAVPITDPDPVAIKVTPRTPAMPPGRGTE